MRRILTGQSVIEAGVERIAQSYRDGHTVVVSVSGGKDSGVCIELAIMAATMTGKLPVNVVFREEEILFPGTHEYLERIAARPEINFHWVCARQPSVNIFNRANPYWWVCDPRLAPEDWVYQPPSFAYDIAEQHIEAIASAKRFHVAPGKELHDVIGLRVTESAKRMLGLVSSGGYLTRDFKRDGVGYRKLRPIYDWTDGDVWLAFKEYKWDRNTAYDVLHRLGVSPKALRIGPITMTTHSAANLRYASKAWPKWWDKVCSRLQGVRQAAQFGDLVAKPKRRLDETWEQCFDRLCVAGAPAQWIRERSITLRDHVSAVHAKHSTEPIPEVVSCAECNGAGIGSWKRMTEVMFNGDPFSLKLAPLGLNKFPALEPEFFREGAGTWGGTPAF